VGVWPGGQLGGVAKQSTLLMSQSTLVTQRPRRHWVVTGSKAAQAGAKHSVSSHGMSVPTGTPAQSQQLLISAQSACSRHSDCVVGPPPEASPPAPPEAAPPAALPPAALPPAEVPPAAAPPAPAPPGGASRVVTPPQARTKPKILEEKKARTCMTM